MFVVLNQKIKQTNKKFARLYRFIAIIRRYVVHSGARQNNEADGDSGGGQRPTRLQQQIAKTQSIDINSLLNIQTWRAVKRPQYDEHQN